MVNPGLIIILVLVVIAILFLFWIISQQSSNRSGRKLSTNISSGQEVPSNRSPATGYGNFELSEDGKSLKYHIRYQGLTTPIISAHFHSGAPGVNGPITRTLFDNKQSRIINSHYNFDTTDGRSGSLSGTWSSTDAQPLNSKNLQELLKGNQYINIHSSRYPDGEIRGQVIKL